MVVGEDTNNGRGPGGSGILMKNIAIAGGLFMIAAHGGGKYSIQRLFVVTKIPHKDT